jgi:hypothetical protein
MFAEYEQKVVVAKKAHDCYGCENIIAYGKRYLSYVSSPNYEFNPFPGKWTRTAFCYQCSKDSPEWGPIGGRVVARYTCQRCGADCNTLDQPHLCKDVKKRYERNAKAVAIVVEVLVTYFKGTTMKPEYLEGLATEVVKALSGRDLGVD